MPVAAEHQVSARGVFAAHLGQKTVKIFTSGLLQDPSQSEVLHQAMARGPHPLSAVSGEPGACSHGVPGAPFWLVWLSKTFGNVRPQILKKVRNSNEPLLSLRKRAERGISLL